MHRHPAPHERSPLRRNRLGEAHVDVCLSVDSSGMAFIKKNFMKQLLIFAKHPEAGKVKIRLAQAIGAVNAALAYKTMVEIVMRSTKPCNGEFTQVLYYDPPELREKFQSWLQISHLKPQSGGDLGERMKQALTQSLEETEHAVLIGTDCIDVDRPLILKAFQDLEKADLVLGPAKDGGYYLIGCRQVYPELFAGIDWGTERVFAQTLERARGLNLSTALLPELEDIDTGEQYGKFGEKIRPDLPLL